MKKSKASKGSPTRILVCVTQQKSCRRLIERGYSLVNGRNSDELFIVHVVKENWKYFGQLTESDALDYLFEVAKDYSASLSVLKSIDIESALKKFAEDNEIDIIVMGESLEATAQQNMIKRFQSKLTKSVAFEIVPIDHYVDELIV